MQQTYLALIPARGGSRGILRKNLEAVGSRTLLQRAILSAERSQRVTECFVSSDDEEILVSATELGAQPHRRPYWAASDTARASDVLIDFLEAHHEILESDRIVYLQPTSPFRTSAHVDCAIALMESAEAESLVGVVNCDQILEKTLEISLSGSLALCRAGADPSANRQVFTRRVYPNGALYIFSVRSFRERGDVPIIGALPFLMGKVESMDIDDPEDLDIARAVAASAGI